MCKWVLALFVRVDLLEHSSPSRTRPQNNTKVRREIKNQPAPKFSLIMDSAYRGTEGYIQISLPPMIQQRRSTTSNFYLCWWEWDTFWQPLRRMCESEKNQSGWMSTGQNSSRRHRAPGIRALTFSCTGCSVRPFLWVPDKDAERALVGDSL